MNKKEINNIHRMRSNATLYIYAMVFQLKLLKMYSVEIKMFDT